MRERRTKRPRQLGGSELTEPGDYVSSSSDVPLNFEKQQINKQATGEGKIARGRGEHTRGTQVSSRARGKTPHSDVLPLRGGHHRLRIHFRSDFVRSVLY